MGEMADYINNTSYDAYEDGYLSEREDADGPPQRYVTCRCCKKEYLQWKNINGKFRLGTYEHFSNKFTLHNCPVNPIKEGA